MKAEGSGESHRVEHRMNVNSRAIPGEYSEALEGLRASVPLERVTGNHFAVFQQPEMTCGEARPLNILLVDVEGDV